MFGLLGDPQRASEALTFIEKTAYFSCKFVGLRRVFLFHGKFQQPFESCARIRKKIQPAPLDFELKWFTPRPHTKVANANLPSVG